MNATLPAGLVTASGDLLHWALQLARGRHAWHDATTLPWQREVARFYAGVRAFDDYLASDAPLGFPTGKRFQGPVADALWHTGQLAMLRRMAGAPIRGENFFLADIASGRVGAEPAEPRREFD